jgi:hypothetical protein
MLLRLALLAVACWGFKHLTDNMKREPDFFDPYEVMILATTERCQNHVQKSDFNPQ